VSGDYTVTVTGPDYSMSVTVYASNPSDALYRAMNERQAEIIREDRP
jgi:hypothetical protein